MADNKEVAQNGVKRYRKRVLEQTLQRRAVSLLNSEKSFWKIQAVLAVLLVPVLFGSTVSITLAQQDLQNGPAYAFDAIVGVSECAECHKETANIWKTTLHHDLLKTTHRSKEGTAISKKMRIKRIKDPEGLCVACHYTVQKQKKRDKAVAGVSCESCHGAARDWLEVHSEFSGKKEEEETPDEELARWAKAEAAGMIRPHNVYGLAKNCISCHAVANEMLVNVGGHPTGDEFELLSWTMGEVRHNVWYTEENNEASPERKRILYLAGQSLMLETAIAALSSVEDSDGEFATTMKATATQTLSNLQKAAQLLPQVTELHSLVEAAVTGTADSGTLKSSADEVSRLAQKLLALDGSDMGAIDSLLPQVEDYVGEIANN